MLLTKLSTNTVRTFVSGQLFLCLHNNSYAIGKPFYMKRKHKCLLLCSYQCMNISWVWSIESKTKTQAIQLEWQKNRS